MVKVDWRSMREKTGKTDRNTFPTGSVVYVGYQGEGKTLSLVHDAIEVRRRYPGCEVWGNLRVRGMEGFHEVRSDDDLADALSARTPRGCPGTLILLDEAHLFFNKKKGIPIEVLTAISQQRKDRKRIMFTSQIWEELDLSIRKQVKEIVRCKRIGKIQVNHITDGESLSWNNLKSEWEAKSIGYSIYKHTEKLYKSYDTLQKIARNSEYVTRAQSHAIR